MSTMPAMWKASAGGSWGSEREAREGMECEVSGLGDQHQNIPGSMSVGLVAGALSQAVVVQLRLRLVALFGALPLWLLGLARLLIGAHALASGAA